MTCTCACSCACTGRRGRRLLLGRCVRCTCLGLLTGQHKGSKLPSFEPARAYACLHPLPARHLLQWASRPSRLACWRPWTMPACVGWCLTRIWWKQACPVPVSGSSYVCRAASADSPCLSRQLVRFAWRVPSCPPSAAHLRAPEPGTAAACSKGDPHTCRAFVSFWTPHGLAAMPQPPPAVLCSCREEGDVQRDVARQRHGSHLVHGSAAGHAGVCGGCTLSGQPVAEQEALLGCCRWELQPALAACSIAASIHAAVLASV